MAGCDPEVGCQIVAEIRRSQAVDTERINVAADRAEKMIEAFEKCMVSIEKHTLALNDGHHIISAIKGDVDGLGERIDERMDRLWLWTKVVSWAVGGLYLTALLSSFGQELLEMIGTAVKLR